MSTKKINLADFGIQAGEAIEVDTSSLLGNFGLQADTVAQYADPASIVSVAPADQMVSVEAQLGLEAPKVQAPAYEAHPA